MTLKKRLVIATAESPLAILLIKHNLVNGCDNENIFSMYVEFRRKKYTISSFVMFI